jgi:hypothetical protein
MQHYNMNLTLKVWRQKDKNAAGGFSNEKIDAVREKFDTILPEYKSQLIH